MPDIKKMIPVPLKRAVKRFLLSLNLPFSDEQYYQKICGLIPELEHYFYHSPMTQIRKRGKALGLHSVRAYYRYLEQHPEEQEYLSHNLTYRGSHFFRGEDWPFFTEKCLSSFRDADRVRVWSAGCSSGEEVYTVIMALMDFVPPEKIDVLASDYNDDLLRRCRNATYGMSHYKEVPEKYLRYTRWVEEGKKFTFDSRITGLVHTENINLLTDDFPGSFDVITCRNVLKFFTPEKIREIQEKLARSLAPEGYLFVSSDDPGSTGESIGDPESFGLTQVEDRSIYRKSI